MDSLSDRLLPVSYAAGFASMVLVLFWWRARRRVGAMLATETRGAGECRTPGEYVEVVGECDDPLGTPGTWFGSCVYYRKRRGRVYTDSCTDQVEEQLEERTDRRRFRLRDRTGRVWVDPAQATVELGNRGTYRRKGGRGSWTGTLLAGAIRTFLPPTVADDWARRLERPDPKGPGDGRVEELWWLPVGHQVYVIGRTELRGSQLTICGRGDGGEPFVVSSYKEETLTRAERLRVWFLGWAAILAAGVCVGADSLFLLLR